MARTDSRACRSIMTQNHSQYAQIPDIKENIDGVDAVLVDEEAVGSVDTPGCGAKILRGCGAFERFLHETKAGEPMVRFLMPYSEGPFRNLF